MNVPNMEEFLEINRRKMENQKMSRRPERKFKEIAPACSQKMRKKKQ